MICLTSDIHHQSLKTGNQAHCRISEIQVAKEYLKMLEKKGIKSTFFITGKSFEEQWHELKPLTGSPFIELGGHNYNAFQHALWHRAWKKINGSYNGPAWFQRRDMQATINIIKEKTGKRIRCWRNHMYMHGPYSELAMKDCRITICSDGVQKDSNGPVQHSLGIYNFPINIMPDHEHLYHAERTKEWVDRWVKRYNWSDDYGPQSYTINEWTSLVLKELEEHEKNNILSNMIIHPITMFLCDEFKSLQKILDFIASRKTIYMSDVLEKTRMEQKHEK